MPNIVREKIHFEAFLVELYGHVLTDYGKGESPDFNFEIDNRRVGVEHTQIFLEGSKNIRLIALESIGNDISRRIQKKGQGLDLNFQATILLNLSGSLNKYEREKLSSQIFDYIVQEVAGDYPQELKHYQIRPNNRLVSSITFAATMQDISTRVTVARAGWVKRTIDEEVKEAISKKKVKIERYSNEFDTVWLLVVADGYGPSSFFDDQPSQIIINTDSPFDKVFYLDFYKKRLSEVIIDRC